MTTHFRYIATLLLTAFWFGHSYAQDTTTINFYDQIRNHDLSIVLTADSILAEESENRIDKIQRAEILGFFGDNFQRLQIHFISILQNPTNPYEYFAYGKSKVKEAISVFQGTITIKEARAYKNGDVSTYKQGFAICDVILYEDRKQPATGFIKGMLTSNFIIDPKGQFRYDALMFVADGFSNNQFIGTWKSYKTNVSKKYNWGDYRIPESGNFDTGAGEFNVDEKYVKNGWGNYQLAWGTYPETDEVKKARQKEKEQWWK